jgi:hypothetical protein
MKALLLPEQKSVGLLLIEEVIYIVENAFRKKVKI